MEAVVQHAHAQEQCARYKTVRNHLHHGAFHAHGRTGGVVTVLENTKSDKQAQGDKTHVRNGRISDQLLHVLLNQGDKADVNHRHQGQRNHETVQRCGCIRGDRQAETDKTVTADLQHDGGQDHRTAGWRFHVSVRQPCVHRPHRDLYSESREETEE